MLNNKINNTIIFVLVLIVIIVVEYFFLRYSFFKKIEKKEIIQQIKLIQIPIKPDELLLKEAQKKSEAEAEQRKKSEAEAEQRKKSEAEAEQRKKSEAEAEQRKKALNGLRDGYIDAVRQEIEKNKKYPLISKSKNEEGVVFLSFRIDKNGKIDNLKVLKSSGFEKLDEAAIKAVQKGMYKNIPNELEDEYLDIQVPIKFNLN